MPVGRVSCQRFGSGSTTPILSPVRHSNLVQALSPDVSQAIGIDISENMVHAYNTKARSEVRLPLSSDLTKSNTYSALL